ncbi:MAG: hypothetical protein LAT78_13580 [Roseinatronobacter sp.]|nr:hypothetical protein [Roseinatronobacter sp.]
MQIIGPDILVFGVDDVPACHEFLTAYGLEAYDYTPENGGFFLALDKTGWKSGGEMIPPCRPR